MDHPETPKGRKLRVLLVDDEPQVLNGLRRGLLDEDFEVFTAISATTGFGLMEHTAIDAVISDERMPGLQGSEFLRIVRRRWPTAARIVLTGHENLESVDGALEVGDVYRVLYKPCTTTQVAESIRTAVRERTRGDGSDGSVRQAKGGC